MRHILFSLAAVAALAVPAVALADPVSLRVRHDGLFRDHDGTLVFGDDAIEFRTANASGSKRWAYIRLNRIVIARPNRLELRAVVRFGKGGTEVFTVLDGTATPELVDFLRRKAPVPVISTLVPNDESWRFRLPARHERRRHPEEGELLIAPDGSLAFAGADGRGTRFWRRRDIARVLPLSEPTRLEIDIAEKRGGRPTPYVFTLPEPLPPDTYLFLWAHITRTNHGGSS